MTMKKIIIFLSLLFFSLNIFAQNPFRYDIKYHRLEFDVDPAVYYIKGAITTYFSPRNNNFSEIAFDFSEEMLVDSVIYHSQEISYTHNNDTVLISFPTPISADILDSITVYFQGEPPSEQGFGVFVTDEHDGVPIMWTLSEPYGAKTWWPCKQTLVDKADSIDLFVTAPAEYKVAGIGLLISETIVGELKTTHWKHRHPITAYLVAFAVTNYVEYYDYVEVNDTITVPILNYVYPEDLSYAQANTPNIIDVFQFYCDTFMIYPYFNEKYGHAQFGRGGGMEHQTMSFMGNFSHFLMAHELAHQWFGDYITCGSWEDIWLNEGFATYLEGMTAEQGLAEYSWDSWKSGEIGNITSQPDGSVFCDDTTQVRRIFSGRLSYSKGAMVLHTLRWKLGDEIFFQSLRNYLNDEKLANSFAKTDDLKQHFEETCECDLTDFFDDWYYGEGYPIYTIEWSQNNQNFTNITIEQTQSHISVEYFEMKVPIKFKGYDSQDTLIVFDNTFSGQTYVVELDFIVKNITFDPDKWIITAGTSVNQAFINKNDFAVKIIPNPTMDNFYVYFPMETKIVRYMIYNSKGQKVLENNISNYLQRIQVDISFFENGIYYIYLQTDNGNFTKKIIKN